MNIEAKEIAYVAGSSAVWSVALVAVSSVFGVSVSAGGAALLLLASVAFGLATLFVSENWVKASMVAMLPAVGVVLSNFHVLSQLSGS